MQLPVMSNNRELRESKEYESFMRRAEERRQSRYFERKREGTEHVKTNTDFSSREVTILPLDLIVSKILTRLPVKTLVRFRSVCKCWRKVTHDPWFISLHLEHSKKNPVLLIAPLNPGRQNDISLYKYDNIDENINKSLKTANLMFKYEFRETLQVLDTPLHANGLILLGSPSTLVVCNPCTREFIKLPDGYRNSPIRNTYDFSCVNFAWQFTKSCGRAALSYVSSSNCYKVVQYFYRDLIYKEGYHYSVGLEILTLGGKKECLRWEVVREDAPYPIDKTVRPKAVGEFVYFKINNTFHESTPKAILSYNLKDEKYRAVDLPPHYMTNFKGISISDLEGDACFTCIKDRSVIDVWILSSTDFTLYPKFSIELVQPVYFCQPVAICNRKLLLHLNDGIQRLGYYNPETDSFEDVALMSRDMGYYEKENCKLRIFNQDSVFMVTSFVESLVPIEGSATNQKLTLMQQCTHMIETTR